MLYCKVQNNTPQPPAPLPQVINGTISNVAGLSDAELATLGLYPFVQTVQPNYNPSTHRIAQELQFTGTVVNQVWAVVALTPEEQNAYLKAVRADFARFLKEHLDAEVACRDYDDIGSACSWKDSTDPKWAEESREASNFREASYKAAYAIENAVLAGTMAIPSRQQFLDAMPKLGWCATIAPPPDSGGIGNGTLT
ncbi:hypothetical protein UFOVP178_28 [uncultured Caudovirales phage]|uniref:Uncharacterized protein n=1 Tax=uncultured Caudovirales phage TaxID=2100421 RepID=A0A6J7WAZ0_9CAUD|nr:hypothetical protein UFOVP178_28 [uncultured Caudovirales phage]